MEKWLVQAKKAQFNEIGKMFNISPVIARIIRNRDIVSISDYEDYLKADISKMHSSLLMKDMKKAISITVNAIQQHKKIRVIGDYDIDGICSGYILTSAIEKLGAKVDFDVPERIKDGYGLNERLIKKAYTDGVELIITCDNGIAASLQIEYGKSLGMEIIVTDHHEIPFQIVNEEKKYTVPNADAVIDVKQPDCGYPFKDLCGAGVAYKFIDALYDEIEKYESDKSYENYEKEENHDSYKIKKAQFMKEYLVFAAIATIGDIVDLLGENRIIVRNGLKYVNQIDNPGLKALIKENGLEKKKINSYHISYVLGPCINAGGRLDTAMQAFNLFRSETETEAVKRAVELKRLNDERKDMTVEYTKKAMEEIENNELLRNNKVLVMYMKECHESLAGIIAGRLKESYYKPSFVFTDSEGGIKGSGRSIDDYSMFEELVKTDTLYMMEHSGKHLLKKYGGHKMAAGVSLDNYMADEFRKYINKNCSLTQEMLVRKVWIDVALPFEHLTEKLVEQLDILEPFGKANEKPVFAEKCTKIHRIKVVGKNRNVLIMTVENKAGFKIEAICFETEENFINKMSLKYSINDVENAMKGRPNNLKMSVIYYPEINDFNGNRYVRIIIKRYE